MPPLSTIRPTLKDLVRHVVPRIAPAWYDVGLQLDLEPDVLDEIEKEKSDQPKKMLAKWLQGSSCTWQIVFNAVEKICGVKPMEDIRADQLTCTDTTIFTAYDVTGSYVTTNVTR